MALELYHSPYRLTMYYQGLLSLIAPSQMMICGTLTLRYLFRIVLSGAVAKGEDFITSGSVTRQGGFSSGYITYPIAFSSFSSVVIQGKQSSGSCEFRVWNTSKTGFQTAGDRETQGLFWIAIGY